MTHHANARPGRGSAPTRALAFAVAATIASACGAAPEVAPRTASDPAASVRSFDALEDEILHDLASIDRRIALRARITPREEDLRRVAMAAVLQEDTSVILVDGAIDPFSFDARARGLEAVEKKVASLPVELPSRAEGLTPEPALERELLIRLVDEEQARLDEERALPRSASALVRAMVTICQQPAEGPARERPPAERAAEQDRWIARRLDEVNASINTNTRGEDALDVIRARELDDALDALEHIVAAPGFIRATQALERVRDTLEANGGRRAPAARSDWGPVAHRAKVHLGSGSIAPTLADGLAQTEKALRIRAEEATHRLGLRNDVVAERTAALLFAETACVDAVPGSRVRSIAAPVERAPSCQLRHVVASADDETARAIALAALHDHVVVAVWALEVARGSATIANAEAKTRLLVPARPDVVARYERFALARPVAALGAGLWAHFLANGAADPFARARALTALGDVPLDVAEKRGPALMR